MRRYDIFGGEKEEKILKKLVAIGEEFYKKYEEKKKHED